MREDDDGTSNLIAFPERPAEPASTGDAQSGLPRDRDLIRRLETIATTLGVPVSTFLGAARERAGGGGNAGQSETAELLRLFGRISDGQTRDQCLALLRMLAAGGTEPSRSR